MRSRSHRIALHRRKQAIKNVRIKKARERNVKLPT